MPPEAKGKAVVWGGRGAGKKNNPEVRLRGRKEGGKEGPVGRGKSHLLP